MASKHLEDRIEELEDEIARLREEIYNRNPTPIVIRNPYPWCPYTTPYLPSNPYPTYPSTPYTITYGGSTNNTSMSFNEPVVGRF